MTLRSLSSINDRWFVKIPEILHVECMSVCVCVCGLEVGPFSKSFVLTMWK